MRFVTACWPAVLLFAPIEVTAQAGDYESAIERWHPEAFVNPAAPAPERAPTEPALKLELTPDDVVVAPSAPRSADGYTLDEMELRVRRAKIGAAASPLFLAGGASLVAYGSLGDDCWCILFCKDYVRPAKCDAAVGVGVVGITGGLAGVIASSILLHRRKRDRDRLRQAVGGQARRVQWDTAQSRLVF